MSAARYEIIDQGCRVKIICPDGSVECFDPSTVGVPNLDDVAAGAIRQQARDIAELSAEVALLTHKVICCGVAASHPNAALTTTGAYADKWDSPQAESVRKLRAERDQLRAELAAAVAERDRFAIQRDQARLTIREIAQILIDQIGSVGPENAINAALRACEVIESMATRLAAIDNAPTYSLTFCHPYSRENPGQLIARPAKDSKSTFEETARSIGIRFNDIENHENQP